MSNHMHLLITEPDQAKLSTAIQVIKQRFSSTRSEEFVWEPRYHDFNVFTKPKKSKNFVTCIAIL
jgi:putative transposase